MIEASRKQKEEVLAPNSPSTLRNNPLIPTNNDRNSILKQILGVAHFPFFTYKIKDEFCTLINSFAQLTKEKCFDEFYSTELIFWDNINVGEIDFKSLNSEESKKVIHSLSEKLFDNIKERLIRNITLKVYNFFSLAQ